MGIRASTLLCILLNGCYFVYICRWCTQQIMVREQLLSCFMWVLGLKLKLSGLCSSTYTCWPTGASRFARLAGRGALGSFCLLPSKVSIKHFNHYVCHSTQADLKGQVVESLLSFHLLSFRIRLSWQAPLPWAISPSLVVFSQWKMQDTQEFRG